MHKSAIALAALAVVILTGCASSRQARNVTPGGFLGDSASLLVEGQKGEETLLVYAKDGTNWASYDKVILEPVAIWSVKPSTLSPDQEADYQKLVDGFHLTLSAKLAKHYELVQLAAPGTLRIQTAIVNGAQANTPLKLAKIVAPYASIADFLWTFATGKPAFVGEVSLEYMIKDSESGALLAAGADRRVGGNQFGRATFTNWGDVKNILTYWSDLTVYRLCVDRAGADCVKPSASVFRQ